MQWATQISGRFFLVKGPSGVANGTIFVDGGVNIIA
jgi:hypothetical protein